MKLILGGINGEYLQNITLKAASQTEEVLAAVAYASKSGLLFDWCWDNKIPLRFWGRLDDTVAVKTRILADFLKRQSPTYVCKLVKYHHAKVIWWRGVGMYIGSANLTDNAWYKNVEAGCFFEEDEIDDDMAADIEMLFRTLDAQASPLTNELYNEMLARSKEITRNMPKDNKFWSSPSFKNWNGLVQTAPKKASERKKEEFLVEWHSTLQELRNISELVSRDENRPQWVSADTPTGAQADQFLHGYYFEKTFEGRKANYQAYYEQNKSRTNDALQDAMSWWANLQEAPSSEEETLSERAPLVRNILSKDSINEMQFEDFKSICENVWAIRDYSRRVRNKAVFLPDGTRYTIEQKIDALAKMIWSNRSSNGSRVNQMLEFVLYGGTTGQLPERLWEAVSDLKWKIDGLGVSALGEIVGWAMPDIFPPRNGRTSKALKSLGYDVKIHVA